jgi:hypothetical protein
LGKRSGFILRDFKGGNATLKSRAASFCPTTRDQVSGSDFAANAKTGLKLAKSRGILLPTRCQMLPKKHAFWCFIVHLLATMKELAEKP